MSNKTKEHLLIIGGTGFIGFHLTNAVKKIGWKVTSISLRNPSRERKVKGVNYIILDIANYKNLKKKLKEKFTYVVNLSGYSGNKYKDRVDRCFRSHFLGTVNLTKILLKKKIKKFVHAGSSAEYGDIPGPQGEDDLCSPTNDYGKSKLLTTNYLLLLHKKQKFPVTILRFFSVYGPKQNKNRVIPQIITGCLSGKKFGVSKGIQYRDFCFIEDVVSAIIKTLKIGKAKGKIINIGSGKPLQIKKVVYIVKKIIGKGKPQFGKIKYSKNENMNVYAKVLFAKKILKWKINFNFKEGLNRTIETHLKQV